MTITIADRRRPAAVGLTLAGVPEMAGDDTVMVQALTTYMEGHEHKNASSAPYRVPRAHAVDLTANGFARVVPEEPAAETEATVEDTRAEDADEAAIENEGKPRARRGGRQG